MKGFKLLMVLLFSMIGYLNISAEIQIHRAGVILPGTYTTLYSAYPDVLAGDSLVLINNMVQTDFGGAFTFPPNITITSNLINPDDFPTIISSNHNYSLELSDGTVVSNVSFGSNYGSPKEGMVVVKGKVHFDKCEFKKSTKPWIYAPSGATYGLYITNSVVHDLESPLVFTRPAGGQVLFVVNNTFYNISTQIIESGEKNNAPIVTIFGNIFHSCYSISDWERFVVAIAQSVLYQTDITHPSFNSAINVINKNPSFNVLTPATDGSAKATDFKIGQLSPAIELLSFVASSNYPEDDIGSYNRKSQFGGSFNDAGAWEYFDKDAPMFKNIRKFDVYYDDVSRPGFQDALLEFDITIAPSDWDSIMIRYNLLPKDTSTAIATSYPFGHTSGYLLFAIDRDNIVDFGSSSSNDSIVYIDNGDDTWVIRTTRPINISKAILDDAISTTPNFIFGKDYALSMFLNDKVGNWTTRDAVDDNGTLPRDLLKIMPLKSIVDIDSISVDAGSTINIETLFRLSDNETPSDYSGSYKVSIHKKSGTGYSLTKETFNYVGSSGVSEFTTNFTFGVESVDELINFSGTGDYIIKLKTDDNLGFLDTIYLKQKVPAKIQFADELSNPINEIDLRLVPNMLRNLKMLLTRNDEDADPVVVRISYSSTNKGKLGTTNNPVNPMVDLSYTGVNLSNDFWTQIPLNTNSKLVAVMITPNKVYVTDTLNIIGGENMSLTWRDNNDQDITDLTIETYSKMLQDIYYAKLTADGGAPVQNARLNFSQSGGAATFAPNTGYTDISGELHTAITFGLNATTTAIVKDYYTNFQAKFLLDASPSKISYVPNGYAVSTTTAGTNLDPDIITTFSSLTINLRAILNANTDEINNKIDDEIISFEIVEGMSNAKFSNSLNNIDVKSSGGGLVTTALTFTPGLRILVKASAKSNTAVARYIAINANKETIKFAQDSIAFAVYNSTKPVTATYYLDGNPINGVDVTFSVKSTQNQSGTFDGLITETLKTANGTSDGQATPTFKYPVSTQWNVIKASVASGANDTLVAWYNPTIPDVALLLKGDGSTGAVSFRAGDSASLMFKISVGGSPIEGIMSSVLINVNDHPDFKFSIDNGTTWLTPGTPISLPIPGLTGEVLFLVKDTKIGDVQVTVTEKKSGVSASKTVTITPGDLDVNKSTFIADPTTIYVPNVGKTPALSKLTLTLVDKYLNPIKDQIVSLPDMSGTSGNSRINIIGSNTITDVKGQLVYTFRDSTAEVVTFTQKVDTKTITNKPVVEILPGDAVKGVSEVKLVSNPSIANGSDSAVVLITLRDKYGNAVPNVKPVSISFKASKNPSFKYVISGNSNLSGKMNVVLTDTIAQFDTIFVEFSDGLYTPKYVAQFTPGPVNYIKIMDKPDGLGVEVGNKTITTDDTLTVYGVGYDIKGNFVENLKPDNVWKWSGTEIIRNRLSQETNSTYTSLIARKVATGTIKLSKINVKSDTTGVITIIGGKPSQVVVSTENNQNETAGTPFNVSLVLYDQYQNISSFTGDQTFTFNYDTIGIPKVWTVPKLSTPLLFGFNNGTSITNKGAFELYSADVDYYLLATSNDGKITTDTTGSTIYLDHGVYSKLKILTGIAGYTPEMDSANIDISTTLDMHTSGFDNWYNYISDMKAKWILGEGKLITEKTFYSQFGDTLMFFRFNAYDSSLVLDSSYGKIKAIDLLTPTITDLTGNIKVIAIPDNVHIVGNNVGTKDSIYTDNTIYVTAGDSIRFYSAGYDTTGFYIENFTSIWSDNLKWNTITGNNSPSVIFKPYIVDTGYISASAISSKIRNRIDTTGKVIVLPGAPEKLYVKILDDDKIVRSGDTVLVEITLKDKYGNIVNDSKGNVTYPLLTFNITPDNTIGAPHNQPPIFGEGPFTFVNGKDTSFVIYAKKTLIGEEPSLTVSKPGPGAIPAGNADTVWVNAGELHHIKIMYGNDERVDTVQAGDKTMTIDDSVYLYAIGYDMMGNFLGETSSDWNSEGFVSQFTRDGKSLMKIGPFAGTTNKANVFAYPVDTTILADTAFNFKVIPGKLAGYVVHVYEADGLPKDNMGDTVAISKPFSIKIDKIDRAGNIINASSIDSSLLAFAWLGSNSVPASDNNGKYEFLNGSSIIFRLSKPWSIDHGGLDSLNVVNMEDQSIRGVGRFMAIDRSGPMFSDESPLVFDKNGDGYIDYIYVNFTEEIQTDKINKKLTSLFELRADTTTYDGLTKYMKIDSVSVIDSMSIALHTSYNFSSITDLKLIPKPKTDIRPILIFAPNVADPTTGIYDIYNNSMDFYTKFCGERVGLVINRATLDDKCDDLTINDELELILSEYIYSDSLKNKLPMDGIIIHRKDSYGDIDSTMKMTAKAEYVSITGLTNVVHIKVKEAFEFKAGADMVKLSIGGGYRDTVPFIYNDVNVDNYPRNVFNASGICENSFGNFPNPIDINRDGKTPSDSIGGIFKISTDRPLEIRADMYNIQANYVNSIKIKVTDKMLEAAGQEFGSRIDFYFGAEGDDGFLKQVELTDNISDVPENDRWNPPVNKNGRVIESGVFVQKVYFNNKYIKDNILIIK